MNDELNDDQKTFLRDLVKSEGWAILRGIIQDEINNARLLATQRGVETEGRWWHSAEAATFEKVLDLPDIYLK